MRVIIQNDYDTCVLKFRGKSSAKPGQTSSMRFLSLAFSRLETSVGERM